MTKPRAGIWARRQAPQGHKSALASIPAGSPVIKCGAPIGAAKAEQAGCHDMAVFKQGVTL